MMWINPGISPNLSLWNNPKNATEYSWVYVRQYCAEIDEAARNRMELIVRSLAEQNGVTEQPKTKWNGCGR